MIKIFQAVNQFLALPSMILFLLAGIILTLKTRFLQIRAIPNLLRIIRKKPNNDLNEQKLISPYRALFVAMATTIGMGNVVGPSIAIMIGGPGALFWLLVYPFFGGLLKFIEVTFALETRLTLPTGRIVGGPAEYLKLISRNLASWYGLTTIFLFITWSALQANTLGQIYLLEGVNTYITGIILASILTSVVFGGIKRIGLVASILVPVMFVAYVSFALLIILKNITLLPHVAYQIFYSAFHLRPTIGGIAGASILTAMRSGVYRSIFITEAGLGTSSIAHSLAKVAKSTDQGILAMYSIVFDTFLSLLSGILVLITGVWERTEIDSTVIYQVFQMHSPFIGKYVLLFGISLFVISTIIGNTLNGSQSFAAISKGKYIKNYLMLAVVSVFLGSISNVPLLWEFSDIMITLVAVPNIIGLFILSFQKAEVLEI